MKKRIHVNGHNIRDNNRDGGDRPIITVKTYKENIYGHKVNINGPSSVVYPKKPLKCGARVWIETEAEVVVITRAKGKNTKKVIP